MLQTGDILLQMGDQLVEQLQAMGDAAKGKIVFFNRPMPRALRGTGAVVVVSSAAVPGGPPATRASPVRRMMFCAMS